MSLDPYISVEWRVESGQNLLIVEQNEEQATGLMVAAWMGLLASTTSMLRQFRCVDFGTAGKSWSDVLSQLSLAFTERTIVVSKSVLVDELKSVAQIIEDRSNESQIDKPPLFLIFNGIHRLRNLDDRGTLPAFPVTTTDAATRSTSDHLAAIAAKCGGAFAAVPQNPNRFASSSIKDLLVFILREGPYVGVHVLMWCDTAANVRRLLSAGKLRDEFGMVAAGAQADSNDSRDLVGNTKAMGIAANRMVFFNAASGGKSFLFRPYKLPGINWFDNMAKKL